MSDWSDIGTSAFDFAEEVIFTDFAPSLARETPGPLSFSGTNQVGWDRIGGSTIAVTYFATSAFTGPEADMVINDRPPGLHQTQMSPRHSSTSTSRPSRCTKSDTSSDWATHPSPRR